MRKNSRAEKKCLAEKKVVAKKRVVPKKKSRANRTFVPKKRVVPEKTNIVKKKLDYVALTGLRNFETSHFSFLRMMFETSKRGVTFLSLIFLVKRLAFK